MFGCFVFFPPGKPPRMRGSFDTIGSPILISRPLKIDFSCESQQWPLRCEYNSVDWFLYPARPSRRATLWLESSPATVCLVSMEPRHGSPLRGRLDGKPGPWKPARPSPHPNAVWGQLYFAALFPLLVLGHSSLTVSGEPNPSVFDGNTSRSHVHGPWYPCLFRPREKSTIEA